MTEQPVSEVTTEQAAAGPAPGPVPEKKPLDGRVAVKVASDRLSATLTIYPPEPGGKPADLELARRSLAEAGVSFGIDPDALARAVAEQPAEPAVVARGVQPTNGEDARLEYGFRADGDRGRPQQLEDGRVDFYNLNLIENVSPGQVLVVKHPPTEGEPGVAVTGEPIRQRPGRDVPLIPGKNVELAADGTQLVATRAGQVILLARNRVGVYPVHEVKGHVDFSTGNIDFVGSVVVRGNVQDGFVIKAESDIEVGGLVDSATLVAGHDILVKSGIQGRSKGRVEAGRNLIAKFIENATVQVGGDVEVGEAFMHSQVVARGRVVVNGKKGLIVGGAIRCQGDVHCKVLGSSLGTHTEVEVGIDLELRERLHAVQRAIEDAEKNIERLAFALARVRQSGEPGHPAGQEMLLKLSRSHYRLLQEQARLVRERQAIEEQIKARPLGRLRVSGTIFPGVRVIIGQAVMLVRDELPPCTLYLSQQGEVAIGPHQ